MMADKDRYPFPAPPDGVEKEGTASNEREDEAAPAAKETEKKQSEDAGEAVEEENMPENQNTEIREFMLDSSGNLSVDEVRPYLREEVMILEPGEKIPAQDLFDHLSAGILAVPAVLGGLALIEAGLLIASRNRSRRAANEEKSNGAVSSELEETSQPLKQRTKDSNAPILAAGSLHQIGSRESQQDSIGLKWGDSGVFAVVADGMGGLSDGDKVSQLVVRCMLQDVEHNGVQALNGNLNRMVAHANDEVNRMLGPRDQYVSGSTVVAALAEPERFQWISVGDSRIYLYRSGLLMQLNREHVYEAELLNLAVNRDLDFQDAHGHAKKKSVSSFIGMGRLKYIDEPMRSIPAQKGDRLLLTTDGVFNTLSDEEITEILQMYPDPDEAAKTIEKAVQDRNCRYQDNFSSILIAWM